MIETTIKSRPKRVKVQAIPENIKLLRTAVNDSLNEKMVEVSIIDACLLSVGEAAMNIVKHGYNNGAVEGDITLELDVEGDELIFRLFDSAPPIDTEDLCSRSLDDIRPGGLGIYFMRELMDSVEFLLAPNGTGNILEMRKRNNP